MTRARIGAIVPHAPLLLLDQLPSDRRPAVERVRRATRALARDLTGTLVVVSPHARQTGVYVSTRGGLHGFGLPRADAACDVDMDMSARAASSWGRPTLEDLLDHGVVVALELLGWAGPVVAVGLGENEPDLQAAAGELAAALATMEVTVVASVNGGAGVTPSGPLTELPGGRALEMELRGALGRDVAGVEEIAPRLAAAGGSCSLGPLIVMARLFAGRSMDVRSYEWPFGVGYPVAITTPVA